jgi:hypothetical protein
MPPIRSSDLAPCPHYCGYRGAGPGPKMGYIWAAFNTVSKSSVSPNCSEAGQRRPPHPSSLCPSKWISHPGFIFAIYFHISLIHFNASLPPQANGTANFTSPGERPWLWYVADPLSYSLSQWPKLPVLLLLFKFFFFFRPLLLPPRFFYLD